MAIRESIWTYPIVEGSHVLSLCLFVGLTTMWDLRLQVWRDIRPWLATGVAIMVVTGVPLFLSEAVRCFYNPPFWIKMGALVVAVTFTVTVQRRITADAVDPSHHPALFRLVGAVSLVLWAAVGTMGRAIGFY